ncbi:MAG: LytTR family DNA-binding domain-containing protein [Prevotellaceae bacterium]|jgi:two-component system LytT family response regulator|nr:LytTR family DNA-binding domain-containing protein [Prevotellaceae bacterium]
MKAVIIDDESPAREVIKQYLQSYADIDLAGEADNGFDALKLIREAAPQLVFLDVQMPKLTGLEVLELLDNPPVVVFSTAYDQFAIRAFEQNAVDYLLKPYSRQRFDAAMRKALAKISAGDVPTEQIKNLVSAAPESLTRIAVKDRQHIHVVPLHELYYIEADGDYVKLHTSKGAFLKEKTMKYFEQNLPQQQFVRVHRSYIVNVDEVAKIELYEKDSYRVHLKNGEALRASSSGYRTLKAAVKW